MTAVTSGGVREAIHDALVKAVREIGVDGEIPDLELGRAKVPEHGDYASSAGLKLARGQRQDPKAIASRLAETIHVADDAARAEAAGGYVNFRLTDDWLRQLVSRITPGYGGGDLGRGERLQVEFGSINPTGPLHIGHGRGVTLGDSICRLLAFTGHSVQREYYVNSDNTQTRRFGESVYARLHGKEPPEGAIQAITSPSSPGWRATTCPGSKACPRKRRSRSCACTRSTRWSSVSALRSPG